MQLRYYQEEALGSLLKYFQTKPIDHNPLLVLPTAAGKTIVFSHLIKELSSSNKRFLILAHRQELVSQAKDKLLKVWPSAPVGVLAASLKSYDTDAQILVASRDTLASQKRLDAVPGVDYIIIDEAHHIAPGASTRYRKILDAMREKKPCRIIGVTATPYRMGQGYIYGDKLDHFFKEVAYQVSIPQLVQDGYLSRLSAFAVDNKAVIDASGVRLKFKGGDYREGELEALAINEPLMLEIFNDWMDKAYLKGRTATVFFCVSVLHAEKMCLFLKEQGIKAEVVTGTTPTKERERILNNFESGRIHALCNVGVLTEGWDAPRTDCLALLRPTQSLGLYVQMCGRGMRQYPGKDNCLMLDYGENMQRHGCLDEAIPEDEGAQAKVKICESCFAVNPRAFKECRECGEAFPKPQSFHFQPERKPPGLAKSGSSSEGYVLSDEKKNKKENIFNVSRVSAHSVTSKGGNFYCKVVFECEDMFNQYQLPFMFGHPKADQFAKSRWKRITMDLFPPKTVNEAVELINKKGAFSHIDGILTKKEGKYENIKVIYAGERRITL